MPKFNITYYDTNGDKQQKQLNADTEAGALSWLLSEHGEDIAEGSPFAVWRGERPKLPIITKRHEECGERGPKHYDCTLPKGHSGPHIATGAPGLVYDQWGGEGVDPDPALVALAQAAVSSLR